MGAVIVTPWVTVCPAHTGNVSPVGGSLTVGAFRLPTDPLFYADLVLQNVVAGSRYRVTRNDTGAQLALDVAPGSSGVVDVTISGVPCYANPMQVDITIRNASGSPTYKVFNTSAFIDKTGGSAYVIGS